MLGLVSRGQISKAVNRINSFGVASIDQPLVMEAMRSKYPARGRDLPDRVYKAQPVESLAGMKEVLKSLPGGTAYGTSGLRPEFISSIAELLSDEEAARLESFGMRYLAGHLPAWFYKIWQTCQTVALFKTKE